MDGQSQPTHTTQLKTLREKLGHINRAIAELEALQKAETSAHHGFETNRTHNVVSIDCLKGRTEAMTKAAQRPPATTVQG